MALLNIVVYVKPVLNEGTTIFAIHAADGTPIAALPSYDVAVSAARLNDLEPLSVH